jgi:NAD dependent epimerase/dehydratase family enzyme
LGHGLGADGGALPILRAAAEAGTPQSFGPGHQWVPWVHIDDLVDLLHRAVVDARWHGAVNMAAPAPVRHRSMIEALAQLSGTGPVVEIGVEDARATLGEAAEILLVSTRLVPRRSLGWGYRFRHDAMTDALASLFPLTSHR